MKENKMNVCFFVKSEMSAGSSRQRAFLVAKELNKIGQSAEVFQMIKADGFAGKFKKLAYFLKFFWNIKKDDILYLQRTIYDGKFLAWIVFYKVFFRRKMIFDFDDAIYFQHSFRTKILTKLADAVVVGSHSLRDWALRYNKKVFIVPTSVDHALYEKYDMAKRPANKKVVIGWIGNGRDHYPNLCLLKPVFDRLIANGVEFKFRLIGAMKEKRIYDLFGSVAGLDAEIFDGINWSEYENIPKEIQKFDIGLMPLIDDEWHRGKCAFKAIEYMACGVSAVVSPVGENNYLFKDGVGGFFASGEEEWIDRIKKLILDASLRQKIGKEGQKEIRRKYSYEANISKVRNVVRSLSDLSF